MRWPAQLRGWRNWTSLALPNARHLQRRYTCRSPLRQFPFLQLCWAPKAKMSKSMSFSRMEGLTTRNTSIDTEKLPINPSQ